MVKEKTPKEENKSFTPIIIIALIAAATVLAIYFVSQSGESDDVPAANTSAETQNAQDQSANRYAKAPAGATPLNFLGSENSSVVVEEFADFQCPTCGVVHPKLKEVISEYGPRIKFVFRNYPLTQIHPNAYNAAIAVEAAGAQGKFWQMQDMIFRGQPTWANQPNARATFKDYAEKIGLDTEQFERDALGTMTKTRVDADIERGRALNVQSTPTVLINGKPVPFNQLEVVALKSLIDAELKKIEGPKETTPENADGNKSNDNTTED